MRGGKKERLDRGMGGGGGGGGTMSEVGTDYRDQFSKLEEILQHS